MYQMTEERKQEVIRYLNTAVSALLDAQISMLIDVPVMYPNEVSNRIEHYVSYEHAALAEISVINSLRELQK